MDFMVSPGWETSNNISGGLKVSYITVQYTYVCTGESINFINPKA